MKIHMLAIDCQNDFCDPKGNLFVTGADKDMARLASMIDRIGSKIDQMHFTLDSHQEIHVAHPIFWVNSKGEHPNPFTLITKDDVSNGVWTTTNPLCRQRALEYVNSLDKNGRYVLCIWPPHCIIGSWGHGLVPSVSVALGKWCKNRFKKVNFVTKGSNPFTEHYSAVQADVPDPSDPTTMLNTELIGNMQDADKIVVLGEARSHCVANTLLDIISSFGEENVKKIVLIKDAMSDVTGFEKTGSDFFNNVVKRGAEVSTTAEFLA